MGFPQQGKNDLDLRTPPAGAVTPACRSLLNRIEKRGPLILTTERGHRPWTADDLHSSFNKACERAGVERTFHDLRRTAATYLLGKGLEASQIAM